MAIFKIVADAEFKADDIDDAFSKISDYFKALAEDGLEVESLWCGGSCEICRALLLDGKFVLKEKM